jgi:hypothetical protein
MELMSVLVGGLLGLAGAGISQIVELKKRRSEVLQWLAESVLGRKTDALTSLFATMSQLHDAVGIALKIPPSSEEEFEVTVAHKLESFVHVSYEALVYLEGDDCKRIGEAVQGYTEALAAIAEKINIDKQNFRRKLRGIGLKLPDEIADAKTQEERLASIYANATKALRNHLNPPAVRRWLRSF